MSTEEKLFEILSPITTRISLIKSGSSPQIVEYAKIDVNTVIERGLLSIPPESLLHALDSYIAEIEDIVNSIEHLHPITLYEDETEPGETFAHPRIIIKKATIIYAEQINDLKAELKVYKDFI